MVKERGECRHKKQEPGEDHRCPGLPLRQLADRSDGGLPDTSYLVSRAGWSAD